MLAFSPKLYRPRRVCPGRFQKQPEVSLLNILRSAVRKDFKDKRGVRSIVVFRSRTVKISQRKIVFSAQAILSKLNVIITERSRASQCIKRGNTRITVFQIQLERQQEHGTCIFRLGKVILPQRGKFLRRCRNSRKAAWLPQESLRECS